MPYLHWRKILFLNFIAFFFLNATARAEVALGDWVEIESLYFKIRIATNVDPELINRKIDLDFVYLEPTEKAIFSWKDKPALEAMANKLDFLYRKAEKILDMYPRNDKLLIKIYKSLSELDGVYLEIFQDEKSYYAFYIHKFNTVFACEEKISESVMAHEMAHAIIDHYFPILPPRKVQEILATYVDYHLKD